MQHEEVDFQISELTKKATIESKAGNHVLAVEIMKNAINEMKQSGLIYSHSSYTQIIPYYQKAGLYLEVEKFCLDELVPLIRNALKNGMNQRCDEIREVHFYQYISKVYDKLRLAAKREKNIDDEARFIREHEFYEAKWTELQVIAQEIELKKEFEEMKEIWGTDMSEWPRSIKKQFESFL
jgi:DNA-binding transcriptional regulator YhcF (GntR family)